MSPATIIALIEAIKIASVLAIQIGDAMKQDAAWTPEEQKTFDDKLSELRKTWDALPDFVEDDPEPINPQ